MESPNKIMPKLTPTEMSSHGLHVVEFGQRILKGLPKSQDIAKPIGFSPQTAKAFPTSD